ncbi:hypothetical protein D3C79_840950 [compost metagenome]
MADRFNDIANQWGATLAGLGTVSTENIVPVAKGGTGGTTAAAGRAGLGLGNAATANILGELSQSGGVPTGALMQQVTNAAGTYWKYASGQMTAVMRVNVSPLTWLTGSATRYVNVTGGLPVAFIEQPHLFAQMIENDIANRGAWITNILASSTSAFSAWLAAPATSTGSGAFSFNILAVGRWF